MAKHLSTIMVLLTPKPQWARFSLRTIFGIITVIAISLGVIVNRARRQQEIVRAIAEWGGNVGYDGEQPNDHRSPWRDWLCKTLGKDYGAKVVSVEIHPNQASFDRRLAPPFFSGPSIDMWKGANVDDDGLRVVAGLASLERIDLDGAEVGDAGLAHLGGLAKIRDLNLSLTEVTDAGLIHLRGLTRLRRLQLQGTRVTNAGVAHLKRLTGLRELYLCGTKIDSFGAKRLQKALPNCKIVR